MRSLWIVDPSLKTPEDQGAGEILRGWAGGSRIFRPALRPGDGPGPSTGYGLDGVVVMGSAASVHDERPWIPSLEAWLRPILAGDVRVPLLGICFGHQLLAHLAAARVGYLRPDRVKTVGVATSRVWSRLLGCERDLRVVFSHREAVEEVPGSFAQTARRAGSEIDGLEHRDLPIFSFQFHPEARGDFARRARLDPGVIDERVREDSQVLLGAFRRLVADGSAGLA